MDQNTNIKTDRLIEAFERHLYSEINDGAIEYMAKLFDDEANKYLRIREQVLGEKRVKAQKPDNAAWLENHMDQTREAHEKHQTIFVVDGIAYAMDGYRLAAVETTMTDGAYNTNWELVDVTPPEGLAALVANRHKAETILDIDTDFLWYAVNRSMVFARDNDNRVHIDYTGDNVVVWAESIDGRIETTIQESVSIAEHLNIRPALGEPGTVCVNGRFLLDALVGWAKIKSKVSHARKGDLPVTHKYCVPREGYESTKLYIGKDSGAGPMVTLEAGSGIYTMVKAMTKPMGTAEKSMAVISKPRGKYTYPTTPNVIELPAPTVAEYPVDNKPVCKVYDIVTQKIIDAMERGVIPWRPTYKKSGGMPRSGATQNPYRGMNAMILWIAGFEYTSNEWFTFGGVKAIGGKVRKGEKGTPILFWVWDDKDKYAEEDETEEKKEKKDNVRARARYYTVFNRDQCEGLPEEKQPTGSVPELASVLDAYLDGENITVSRGMPAYWPSDDHITMPEPDSFDNLDCYYKTLGHEAVHSTGASGRLNRFVNGDQLKAGSENYGKEELVAEVGAAMLCELTGTAMDELENAAAYCQAWLNVIKWDRQLLIGASQHAQKAVDMIISAWEDSKTQEKGKLDERDTVIWERDAIDRYEAAGRYLDAQLGRIA
jgi:antirestriction protein ArdC